MWTEELGSGGHACSAGAPPTTTAPQTLRVFLMYSTGSGGELVSSGGLSRPPDSGCPHPKEEAVVASVCIHRSIVHKHSYLHGLSTFALGPEKGFAIPLNLTRKALALSWVWGTGVPLAWLYRIRLHLHLYIHSALSSPQPRNSLEPLVIPR